MRRTKRKLKNRIKIEKYQVLYLALIVVFDCLVYGGARILTTNRGHMDISTGWDQKLPFVPEMILVYWGCYIFWAIMYVIIVRQKKQEATRFLIAELLGKAICFLFYMLLPTTMVRATVEGNGIWEQAIKSLYDIDAADLLFPSIHCYVSWMCYLGVKKITWMSRWTKLVVLAIAILICASTLLVKQHVIYDVIGGVLIAELCYRLLQWKGWLSYKKEQ